MSETGSDDGTGEEWDEDGGEDRTPSGADRLPSVGQLRSTASVLGFVVLVVVVLPFVLFAVPQLAGANQSYVVLSGSMEPTISPGDVILASEVDPAAIETGDVITFERPGESTPTTHRVVEVTERDGERAFLTKGDANENVDQAAIPASQVEGRIPTLGGFMFVIPFIGHVVKFATTQLGFATIVVTPLLLLVISEIYGVVSATTTDSAAASSPDDSGDGADRSPGDAGQPVDSGEEAPDVDADGDAMVTLTPGELRLGAIVLAAFVVYCLWVVYQTRFTVWSVGVAASVTAAFVMVVGMYLGGRGGTDETPTPPSATDGGRVDTADPGETLDAGDDGQATEGGGSDE
jgi:signal peptidase